jgi:hypothetical protein
VYVMPSTAIERVHPVLQGVPLPFTPRGHISQYLTPGSSNRQVGNASSPRVPSIAPFHVRRAPNSGASKRKRIVLWRLFGEIGFNRRNEESVIAMDGLVETTATLGMK